MEKSYLQGVPAEAPPPYPGGLAHPQQRVQIIEVVSAGFGKSSMVLKRADLTGNSAQEFGYFVDVSNYTPGKPDVTLHRGEDKNGPALGIARFPHFSHSMRIGIVPDVQAVNSATVDESQLWWEDLRSVTGFGKLFGKAATSGAKSGDGVFSVPARMLNLGASNTGSDRIELIWKRTHHDHLMTANGASGNISMGSLKLVLAHNQDFVVAQFEQGHSCSFRGSKGRIVLLNGVATGPAWEVMAVLTLMAMIEHRRRQQQAAVASGAAASS